MTTHDLPARGEYLLTGGHVLTMDSTTGDLPAGEVHIKDGEIIAVADRVEAPAAERIDTTGMIVLPGLVETHWHMWSTLLRGLSDGITGDAGYFSTLNGLAPHVTPEDAAAGVSLSCAEALNSGYTTVHDWAQNVRSPEHADAEIAALRATGLRARFSYGWRIGHDNARTIDLPDLERLHQSWPGGLIGLGMAWRGPGGSDPSMRVAPEVYRAELEAARAWGLPLTLHASGPRRAAGQIQELADAGLLGPDMQVVHANSASGTELAALAACGASVSTSPYSEMPIGYGLPATRAFLDAGIPTGLSVDTTMISGNADPFAIMKLIHATANGDAENEYALSTRRVLDLATLQGARAMGLDHLTGSLTAGKRADVITIDTEDVNLGVCLDPVRLVVTAAQPANVDTVIVDGRILKRGGKLCALDGRAMTTTVRVAATRLLDRSA